MYNLFLLFQKDGTLQRFKDFKPRDFFPNALTQMHVGRSHRCLGSPMLDMIDTAIEFSNEYHSEVNKAENEKDIAKIDALQKWKGLNEELQCMKEVVGWTSSIIDILNDRSFKLSNNPNCPESVRRIKLLRDALIWFIDWRDRAIIDSKSRDLMEQYSIFFTKNSTDDLIQVLQGTLNLLEINTKEITLLDGSTYWSYILLKGVSQDRLENHFSRIRSISVNRLHQRLTEEAVMVAETRLSIQNHTKGEVTILEHGNSDATIKRNCGDSKNNNRGGQKRRIKNIKALTNSLHISGEDSNNLETFTTVREKREKKIKEVKESRSKNILQDANGYFI